MRKWENQEMRELENERMGELENLEMREWGASYKKMQYFDC